MINKIIEFFKKPSIRLIFKTNIDKNYSLDDDIINNLIEEQWGTSSCGVILNLLYPSIVLQHGKSIAEDHMHPKAFFEKKGGLANLNLSEESLAFFKDKRNYNSCLNLQLLETIEDECKSDKSLLDWAKESQKSNDQLLLEKGVSLELKDFKALIESRRKVLLKKLKTILSI